MAIRQKQISEWRNVFIGTYLNEGYPVKREDIKGKFYPQYRDHRAIGDTLSEVQVKGDFLIEGEEEQQQVTAYFKLHPQPEGLPIWEFLRMD
jgi:hypothetical protein